MPSVCLYFQVHQPLRVRHYSYFDSGYNRDYFDDEANGEILRKVAKNCYLPTNELMLKLIKQYKGQFCVSYSLSGVLVEQLIKYAPDVLDSFIKLAETGCVEFLAETYYHSLSSVYDEVDFQAQVYQQHALMEEIFGVSPKTFRNTELIYNDRIGELVHEMGYETVLAEGADDILRWRSPNFVYSHPDKDLRLLLKNYRLSDDIAFRFSNKSWKAYPLTAEKYAAWLHMLSNDADVVNLFMDYETFGEHQWADTGIFKFLEELPKQVLKESNWSFVTPAQAVSKNKAVSDLAFHRFVSWADTNRDLSAWCGNSIQNTALKKAYEISSDMQLINDSELKDLWRKLQISDHFYYMSTAWAADGDVHAYFSPFDSPYDAFIFYMNILRDFSSIVKRRVQEIENGMEIGSEYVAEALI